MKSLGTALEYRLKAKEAEMHQEQATDPKVKASWERIVVGYMELADMVERCAIDRRPYLP